jgi:hypothetical protein
MQAGYLVNMTYLINEVHSHFARKKRRSLVPRVKSEPAPAAAAASSTPKPNKPKTMKIKVKAEFPFADREKLDGKRQTLLVPQGVNFKHKYRAGKVITGRSLLTPEAITQHINGVNHRLGTPYNRLDTGRHGWILGRRHTLQGVTVQYAVCSVRVLIMPEEQVPQGTIAAGAGRGYAQDPVRTHAHTCVRTLQVIARLVHAS